LAIEVIDDDVGLSFRGRHVYALNFELNSHVMQSPSLQRRLLQVSKCT